MKAGFKTTEFWLAVGSAVLGMLKEYFVPDLPVEAFYGVWAYIVGRLAVKMAAEIRGR